jgi:hypothetical protein
MIWHDKCLWYQELLMLWLYYITYFSQADVKSPASRLAGAGWRPLATGQELCLLWPCCHQQTGVWCPAEWRLELQWPADSLLVQHTLQQVHVRDQVSCLSGCNLKLEVEAPHSGWQWSSQLPLRLQLETWSWSTTLFALLEQPPSNSQH